MSLRTIILTLVLAGLMSIVVMVQTSSLAVRSLVYAAALAFGVIAVLVGVLANRKLWTLPANRVRPQAAPVAAHRNAIIMALVMAWGAAAFFAIYGLTPLRWQHWWQYGAGMALYAIGLALYADMLARPGHPAARSPVQFRVMQLTVVQGMLALGGLAWLILSGKLDTQKMDWAANAIFLGGGVAITGLSAIAVVTQQRLTR